MASWRWRVRPGFPAERISLHGNNKSEAELRAGLAAGVGRYVIDSLEEIDRLADLAADAGVVADVLIRVTTGVEAHTHEFIATAHEDQKFGLSLTSGAARDAVLAVAARPELRLVGIHSHIGSQIFNTSGFEVAAHRVVGFIADLLGSDGISVAELNLGGGMGIAYLPTDDPVAPVGMAEALRVIVAGECARRGIDVPLIAVEPGRAIVGPSMVTLYEVGTIKPVEYRTGAWRTYVSVDGGMSDNIRTALYDADYTVVLASRVSSAPAMLTRVVGKHCESGDIVVRDAWLPSDLERGDLLAVAVHGRLLPGHGLELQHGRASTRGVGARRRGPDRAATGDRGGHVRPRRRAGRRAVLSRHELADDPALAEASQAGRRRAFIGASAALRP